MAKPRRELKNRNLSCRTTARKESFVLEQCESLNIGVSEYLAQLIDAEITRQKRRKNTG